MNRTTITLLDIVARDGMHERLVEAVRGGDHDVQAGVGKRQRARARQRVEQIKRTILKQRKQQQQKNREIR